MTDREKYLQDPCGTLSIPYCKAERLTVPASVRIIHCSEWDGQYSSYQRFFRVKHDLKGLVPPDFDYDTISIDQQTAELAEMINASYRQENISVSEQDILQWQLHDAFREDLCIYINADGGRMVASGTAEYDAGCREGFIEWVQVLPEYRNKGYGKKIVAVLLSRLKDHGAEFVTVSGDLDSVSKPLELYRRCGFTGDDVWYICRVPNN